MRNIDEGRASVVPSSQTPPGRAGGQVPPLFTRLASSSSCQKTRRPGPSSAVSVNIKKNKKETTQAHHIPQPSRSPVAPLLSVFSKETYLEQKDRVLADIFAAGLLAFKKIKIKSIYTSCLSIFPLQCFCNTVVKLSFYVLLSSI